MSPYNHQRSYCSSNKNLSMEQCEFSNNKLIQTFFKTNHDHFWRLQHNTIVLTPIIQSISLPKTRSLEHTEKTQFNTFSAINIPKNTKWMSRNYDMPLSLLTSNYFHPKMNWCKELQKRPKERKHALKIHLRHFLMQPWRLYFDNSQSDSDSQWADSE